MNEEKSIIALGNKGIQLTNFEELFRFSQFVSKAGFAPRGMDTPEKVFLAVQMGMELGLSPMMSLQNVAVINGRPGFYGDLVLGLIQSHPSFEDMTTVYGGDDDAYACEVTIKRKGRSPSTGMFSIAQAKAADLLNNPSKKDTWGKYTDDMLFWRAFARAKKIFADVLRGFKSVEELRDYPDEKIAKAVAIKKPEIVHPHDTLEKIDWHAELKRSLAETTYTQAEFMEVMRANSLGGSAGIIDDMEEQDIRTALGNWPEVVKEMEKNGRSA